jgi:hypothetical protein
LYEPLLLGQPLLLDRPPALGQKLGELVANRG